jgi:uncharacterized protein YkwD
MSHRRRLLWLCVLSGAVLSGAAAQDKPEKKDPAKFEISKDEQKVLDLTNAERAKEKAPPLKANAKLFAAARKHSENMAKKGELNHVLDGKGPGDRIDAEGYAWSAFGENIAYGDDLTPDGALKIWMNSPPHRANILKQEFQEIGIGIARTANGQVYYTQVFGKPRN